MGGFPTNEVQLDRRKDSKRIRAKKNWQNTLFDTQKEELSFSNEIDRIYTGYSKPSCNFDSTTSDLTMNPKFQVLLSIYEDLKTRFFGDESTDLLHH